MNVKVKFKTAVIEFYYWVNELHTAEQWRVGARAKSNSNGVVDYIRYCDDMYSIFSDDDNLVKLTTELGSEVKFQWKYYVTMPREEAFRLQLMYGDYIEKVKE